MKWRVFLPLCAAAPLFILFLTAGKGYPLLNPAPVQLLVSETNETGDYPADSSHKILEMIYVEGGSYLMGGGKLASSSSFPIHRVTLSSFYISRFETTCALYDAYCKETATSFPPDQGKGRGDRPVSCISWYDAVEFCNWLSLIDNREPCYSISVEGTATDNYSRYDTMKQKVECDYSANGYRLPTEAEWEFAARGGLYSASFIYSGSNEPDTVAWHYANSYRYPEKTGLKEPNELGLCDMSGNVYEWTGDWYSRDYTWCEKGITDPSGFSTGSSKIIRGGSCFFDYRGCVTTYRKTAPASVRLPYIGFRVVRRDKTQ